MKSVILILMALIVILNGCQVSEVETGKQATEAETDEQFIEVEEGLLVEVRSLSDIQIDVCNAADEGGTCDTKLAELGIILKEECCEVLGKCC